MSAPARKPTAEQARAAQTRNKDVFLEAGAGTGKTGVLVERYCDAVADDGVSPEQILAFTFTEKAAAELRHRIRAELERRAKETEGEEKVRLSDTVRALGAAPITTIHGFCRRLLASHPVSAGLDPRFRVLDAAEARRVGWAAFDQALEDFADAAGGEGERLIALLTVPRARQIVLGAHEELVSRGDPPELPPVYRRDLDEALAAIESAADAMAEAGKGSTKQKDGIALARELAAARRDHTPTVPELENVELRGSTKVPEVKACQDAIRAAVAVATEPGEGLAAYGALDALLRAFAERFAEAKTERSGLDFEDLQRGAVDLLARDTEIGIAYRERFTHLLVDEFQDTNALQLSLIEALRGLQTKLFCVGDEFQSIYGFRHADVDIFTGERERFDERRGAETMKLRGNFRSQPQIVAAVNAIGDSLLERFTPLTVGRAAASPVPAEFLVTRGGDWKDCEEKLDRAEGDRTPLECVVEARALAQRLRTLVDEGRRPGEIVVLLRAFTQVEAFEGALERAGLPAYVVGGGYWSRQQAQDMVALLGTIANPLADEPLLGALASPAGGVLPDTLWALRRSIGRGGSIWMALLAATGRSEVELEDPAVLAALPEAERGRLETFTAAISALRSTGTRLPLETLIGRAVEETGYDLAILRADHGRERYANVRKMMRLARDFEAVEGRDLRGFLDYAALSAEQDAEAPAAVESEEGSGVRIMTIHAAKGLEFPVVAVAQLGRTLIRGSDSDLAIGRPAEDPLRAGLRLPRLGADPLKLFHWEQLVEEARERAEAEELRLAYVAVTRARDHLILSGVLGTQNHQPRAMPVLRRVLAGLGNEVPEDGQAIPLAAAEPIPGLTGDLPPAPELAVSVVSADSETAVGLAERRRPLARDRAEPDAPPPLVDRPAPALPARTLSYSTLSEHARCGYRFYVERVLGLSGTDGGEADGSGRPRNRAMALGNATHELLRRSAETRWAPATGIAIGAALARQGIVAADTEAAERIDTQLTDWLGSDLPAELRGGGVRLSAEHPFLLDIAGTTIRGSIDLLAERPGRPPLVLDYKTDRLDGDDPAARAERYGIQRNIYALAVAEALKVPEVEVVYVFLERPGEPASVRLGPEELAAARAALSASVEAVTGGIFEVTAEPDWPLCRDCPARRRLCPSPAPRPEAVAARGAASADVGGFPSSGRHQSSNGQLSAPSAGADSSLAASSSRRNSRRPSPTASSSPAQ